jgi:toxin ParE1/3/4
MSRYRLTAQAEGDLDDIWSYIASNSVDAADRVVARIIQRFPSLAQMREIGRSRDELASGLRSFPVREYLIFYRLISDGVEILRVIHGSRDIPSEMERD